MVVASPPIYTYDKRCLQADWARYCRDLFRTFENAQRAIPSRKRIGGYCTSFGGRHRWPGDYAALLWFEQFLSEPHSVFDFRANLGWAYCKVKQCLHFLTDLKWTFCNVSVAEAGQNMARERDAEHWGFTSDFADCEECNTLHTSGTLQVVEHELGDLLTQVRRKPRHLIINRAPLSDRPTYFPVFDAGTKLIPYRTGNFDALVSGLEHLGYELIDSWRCYELSRTVLFPKSRRLSYYSGFYFWHHGPSCDTT